MAEWSNAIMTDVGNALQAKVNAGQTKLTFILVKVNLVCPAFTFA